VRSRLASLEVYEAPTGRGAMLRMDANEGPAPPAKLLRELLASSAEVCTYYPEYADLVDAAARAYGVAPDRLMPVAGADEGIRLVLQAFCGRDAPLLSSSPTFSMYAIYAAMNGAKVVRVAARPDFSLDLDAMLAAMPRAAVVVLASPDTPAGRRTAACDVEALAAAAGERPFLLDETYAEFCGQDLAHLIERHPNVIVLRTLSKSHGVPGLRCGFVLAAPDVLRLLAPLRSPYNVSAVSARVGRGLLERDTGRRERLDLAVRAREDLGRRLTAMGVEVFASDTHFLLARLGDGAATEAAAHLGERGILVRGFADDLKGFIRVSAASMDAVERFDAAFRPWLGAQGGTRRKT
jgi:histidinol-phosphate aminotransferase